MSYDNFRFHQEQRNMARAQAAYDAHTPDDDDSEPCGEKCSTCDGECVIATPDGQAPCPDCKGEGLIFHHQWHLLPGEAKDGTRFAKCRRCGAVEEQ